MNSINEAWKEAILRAVIVAGLVVAFGFVVFRPFIFIRTMVPYQFLVTGVTLGISYAAFKSRAPRIGFIALFAWYALLTGRHASQNIWSFILFGCYIIGITAAVYVYILVAGKSFVNGRTQRIIASTLIIGVANGLIALLLGSFSIQAVLASPRVFLEASFYNVLIGAVMGIVCGVGIELAEYVLISLLKV